jgi:2-polyprenyl-6-methoxyphenol hydroxylase-like FAD-dependent oxidoreductase
VSRNEPGRRGRAVIIGGGISGLAAAILLAKRYRHVTILERDVRPAAASPDEAFARWERAGVPQFRHSHVFLARLFCVLRERFPQVLELLRSNGALEVPLTVNLPPTLDLGRRERGDGELVLLGCRRAAFEWALAEVARRTQGVEFREGVFVEGLVATRRRGRKSGATSASRPRVTGVRFRELPGSGASGAPGAIPWYPRSSRGRLPASNHGDGAPPRRRTIRADLVIDASGRRSRAGEWLAQIGAAAPRERSVETGIFYFTRFYRLTGPRPPGATTGLVAGDVGWLKCATFPGDGDTFSITLGTSTEDRPFRALAEPAVFEAVIAAFPQLAVWRARGISRPIDGPRTPVLVMGGLSNRAASFVRQGRPLADNFLAIGDAVYHTNPIYGRGATCALLSASALDDALASHPQDFVAAALAYADRTRADIKPFWDSAAAADQMSSKRSAGDAQSSAAVLLASWSWLQDPRQWIAALGERAVGLYLDQGLLPASRSDGLVYRAVMRVMNMLDEPASGLFAPVVIGRVLPFIARSLTLGRPPNPFGGPTRAQALEIVAAARKRGRAAKRRLDSSRAASVAAPVQVLKHA